MESRNSSDGIVTGYGLDDRMIRVLISAELAIFFFDTLSITVLGPTQSPLQWIPGPFPWG
jgi:hypothetical protein